MAVKEWLVKLPVWLNTEINGLWPLYIYSFKIFPYTKLFGPSTKGLYRVPEILVEVLEDSSVSDVGHVDVAFEGDAVATNWLRHGLQIFAGATLDLWTSRLTNQLGGLCCKITIAKDLSCDIFQKFVHNLLRASKLELNKALQSFNMNLENHKRTRISCMSDISIPDYLSEEDKVILSFLSSFRK